MAFYTTKQDLQRSKDLLLRQPDMYVSEIKYSGSGVAGKSGNDITLTPATSPAWTINEFQSAVGLNRHRTARLRRRDVCFEYRSRTPGPD